MILKTYIDKSNTLISYSQINTARNPIAELFYGGPVGEQSFSRHIFYFDIDRIKMFYTGGTFTDISNLEHTLKFTNTGAFNNDLLNSCMGIKHRATSFDLIVFKVNQFWDSGVGYDYNTTLPIAGDRSVAFSSSNWYSATTANTWSGGTGTYSGTPEIIATQHFDKGNEDLIVDITSYVNGVLTGDTNYGLGIAYSPTYESLVTETLQYVGFFTNNTQTFYEPYVETKYKSYIKDDRNNFYLDKPNKLYLYVNLNGTPTNLDNVPTVTIYDQDDLIFSSYTQSAVTHVTKGVYSIDIQVPSTIEPDYLFTDVWENIQINGVGRPPVRLNFALKCDTGYYNIGDSDMLPKKVAVSVSGIKDNEIIKRGDIRKVILSTRIPYTVEQTQSVDLIQYRLYVKEGTSQVTVIDFENVEQANNVSYFLLDTLSLIPNEYFLDIKVVSNLEVTTLKDVVKFQIMNDSNLRNK